MTIKRANGSTYHPTIKKMPEHPEGWGLILGWLNLADPDVPFWQQIHNSYAHGGGWRDASGFEPVKNSLDMVWKSNDPEEEDEEFPVLDWFQVDDQILGMHQYAMVSWRNVKTGEFKTSRVD